MKSIWDLFIAQENQREEATVIALENLKIIDEQLKQKKFFNGETIGYLDIALGCMANFISILEEVACLKLMDVEKFPHLLSWMQNISNAPEIKECWPPRDKMITKYRILREKYVVPAASTQ